MHFNVTTFVFEVINFLVLMFLLQRFVFRPLRRGLAERRAALASKEQAAQELAERAAKDRAELDARAKSIDALRDQALRDASTAAAEERSRILEQAREDAAADRARAQHVLEAERKAGDAAVRELAITHSTALASRLLSQLAPDALDAALFDALLMELEKQAPGWRADATSADDEVEVTWAHPPNREHTEKLERTVRAALGDRLAVVHRDDGSLGAGAVVRFGHRVLDATTAGQLAAFRGRARTLLEEGVHG